MTDDNNTTAGLDQADEDILSYTVSDEALEAVAGSSRPPYSYPFSTLDQPSPCC